MPAWSDIPYHINPVCFSLGPIKVHWYGIMYLISFLVTYYLVNYRIKNEKLQFSKEIIYDFLTLAILGAVIGGRLGYVFFYDFGYFIKHPVEIISPFDFSDGFRFVGIYGMSYHGGLIGVALVFILFCRRKKLEFFEFADLFSAAFPLGYMFGRIGNFINGELFGRVTDAPWGMYFPSDLGLQLRHPSQLYEALFEGLLLFVVLWSLRKKSGFNGFLSSLYLIGYGVVRFFIEFYREPDSRLGFVAGPFTMGQVLCLIMIVFGVFFYYLKKPKQIS